MDERVARYHALVFYGLEIFEIFDESVCHKELRIGVFDLHKRRQRLFSEHAKLVRQCGVEHKVCPFLIGINPLELTAADGLPHIDGVCRGIVAEFHIANDAADKAQVRGVERRMIVDVDGQLRCNVDLVFLMFWYGRSQFFVESVYAFDDDRAVFVHLDSAPHFLFADHEIELGQRHFFAVDKVEKIFVELLDVEAVDVFKVNFVCCFALNGANLGTFEIIVVHRDHHGIDAARQQLYAHAIAERGFAAR